MKYSGYYNCKFCGKTWWHKSNWVPFELVDWFYELAFLFHMIFHHHKELNFKRIMKGLYQVLLHFVVAIMWIIVTTIQIIFYPFKLLVDLFY